MKKLLFILLVSAFACKDKQKDNVSGGAGIDQSPTTMSADSANGYADKTARDSMRH